MSYNSFNLISVMPKVEKKGTQKLEQSIKEAAG